MSIEYTKAMYRHAIRSLLWSETISVPEDMEVPDWYQAMDGENFDAHYGIDDVEDNNDELYSDVVDFVTRAWGLIHDMDPEQVGHDFILSRNHHGAGFWDRGNGLVGDKLHDMATEYGDVYLDVMSEDRAVVYA